MLHNILDATNSRKKTYIKNNYIITNTKNVVPPPPPEPVAPNSDIVFTKKIKEVPQAIPNHQSSIPLIPLNIFQTWHSLELPPKMEENLELMKKTNPEFKHFLYDDDMCREFIEKNFSADVVWAFDKLKPGAYKADLWRYCILYTHGGIYLDIKFKCINNFKLIQCTDREYWVKDRKRNINGIYQAFMVTFPKNKILWNAIQQIISHCKTTDYTNLNPLAISGPSLIGQYFNEVDFNTFVLQNVGDIITLNGKNVLAHYQHYRSEQRTKQKTQHYDFMWHMRNSYNFPIIESIEKKDLSNEIRLLIGNKQHVHYASIPNIICNEDNILVHLEYKNCVYSIEGLKNYTNIQNQSRFSYFTLDFELEKGEETFYNFTENTSHDLKLVQFNNELRYIVNNFDTNYLLFYITSGPFDVKNIKNHHIRQDIYNKGKHPMAFVSLKNDLHIVYKWFPLLLGKINNKIHITTKKYNTPSFLKNITHSSNGILYKNELWFILCKEEITTSKKPVHDSKHLFIIFDKNMDFLRYSEFFTFTTAKNEFCTSFFIKENYMYIGYGLFNKNCFIAKYDIIALKKQLKWFTT